MPAKNRIKRKKTRFSPLFFLILGLGAAGIWIWHTYHTPAKISTWSPRLRAAYTVLLDAGHGGVDGGASAPDGMLEKELNLTVARKTELCLRFMGVSTLMTRSSDISLHDPSASTIREIKVSDLKRRAALAQSLQNGVLLSIHQNTFGQTQYSGLHAFYGKHPDSAALGIGIQTMAASALDPANRRTAAPADSGIYLMQNVSCPAVLVECGFLSNAEEYAKLKSGDYQKKLAAVLTSAFLQWESDLT